MTPDQFKAWRTGLGLSQTAAASALGISRSSVVNYESGERREDSRPAPIPTTVVLACDAVSITMVSRHAHLPPEAVSDAVALQCIELVRRLLEPSAAAPDRSDTVEAALANLRTVIGPAPAGG